MNLFEILLQNTYYYKSFYLTSKTDYFFPKHNCYYLGYFEEEEEIISDFVQDLLFQVHQFQVFLFKIRNFGYIQLSLFPGLRLLRVIHFLNGKYTRGMT